MIISLSHIIDSSTQLYGNRGKVILSKTSSIKNGDIANNTSISSTLHLGTHIDFPMHFYKNGQTYNDFSASDWCFDNISIIEISNNDPLIYKEIENKISKINIDTDILLIKTEFEKYRGTEKYWKYNPGLSPKLYTLLTNSFKRLRAIGLNTISISGFQDRLMGRKAHKEFLNPSHPILLIEDMRLKDLDKDSKISQLIIAPLPVSNSDAAPCNVFAFLEDMDLDK